MSGTGNMSIKNTYQMIAGRHKSRRAVSMLEVLVAIAIITILIAIKSPALMKVRMDSNRVRTMSNQRQIVTTVGCFALDNNGKYPESVAVIGLPGGSWNWQEPTMITAYQRSRDKIRRSMSAYLRSYINDASILFCPNAPEKYDYFQAVWDAGDNWDNPDTLSHQDPMFGTFCFYWNYIGLIGEDKQPFKGPQILSGEPGTSKLLVSDYFGYGHWRNNLPFGSPNAFGSCEKFKGASVTPGTEVSSSFWSARDKDGQADLDNMRVKLHAGYVDGHVERYTPSDVVPMRVSKTADGSAAYPDELGPGIFYLPENALP